MGSLKWRDKAEGTYKTPVDELKQLKYRGRDLEGQEDARKNSGDGPIYIVNLR